MADVLVRVMQRRVVLADRAGRLRKELAEIDAEVARLEAAEVVIGQFIEAERSGQTEDPAVAEELERVTGAPGRAGCCWSRTANQARTRTCCRPTTRRS